MLTGLRTSKIVRSPRGSTARSSEVVVAPVFVTVDPRAPPRGVPSRSPAASLLSSAAAIALASNVLPSSPCSRRATGSSSMRACRNRTAWRASGSLPCCPPSGRPASAGCAMGSTHSMLDARSRSPCGDGGDKPDISGLFIRRTQEQCRRAHRVGPGGARPHCRAQPTLSARQKEMLKKGSGVPGRSSCAD